MIIGSFQTYDKLSDKERLEWQEGWSCAKLGTPPEPRHPTPAWCEGYDAAKLQKAK